MAKDVDLSSKEWTDLIFEGKNKAFGAYTLRQAKTLPGHPPECGQYPPPQDNIPAEPVRQVLPPAKALR